MSLQNEASGSYVTRVLCPGDYYFADSATQNNLNQWFLFNSTTSGYTIQSGFTSGYLYDYGTVGTCSNVLSDGTFQVFTVTTH
jgi:hypothetical protein